jgi:lipoprotein-releasing system ATP-binding protein
MTMTQKEVILETKALSKYFYEPSKFQVLKEISFQAYKGEFLTMIGKSGSGKSTLLYCLSTMDTDYTGELHFQNDLITGKSPNEMADIRNKDIGFIFQFHYLLPEFTCLKNIMLPALKLGQYSEQEIEHRAMQKLELLDLGHVALKQASKLSGGQQQRVSIARSLINDPALILCDEPTGNLDIKNTQIVFDTFKQLSSQNNQTIIAVTHDNDFAAGSDRIIEMADGVIISK